ncbi:PaaI family thioesterase [Pokkaliibacter sp. MBI-7]|uniref:PaaI family thioesterase n=1 Tax=Pokkaliibacter sp. MBI-7 TaxID=3040600 RepID=UPI00244B26B0|nr:PaaI family thioesterase [Pokkaliibacter sp. MBI-7]MDH2432057.1 PaaI family thioesterase [Pokkaliibacter sp. MBI-7]
MSTPPHSDWIAQHEAACQRALAGGGKAGIATLEQLAGKSGREILEGMMAGTLPYPPMNDTMNMTLLETGDGYALFQGIPLPQHYNPAGTVHGGWFATLLDSALGCAVQSTLAPARSYTTVELSTHIVRPASYRTGPLRASARVIHDGRRLLTAEARVEDESGRLYAHATAICMPLDMPPV